MEMRVVLRTMIRRARLLPTGRRAERTARHTVTIAPARGAIVILERRA
jgi:hypothetical protein